MNKTLIVAKRDYLAAIRSKPFLVGLIVVPLMGGSGFIGIGLMKAKPDIRERRVAIVDRTGVTAESIISSAQEKNAKDLFDKKTGRQLTPRYVFETIAPDDSAPDTQRLTLSDRVRGHQLFAFIEVGHDALHPPAPDDSGAIPQSGRVDYYSNAGGVDETREWLDGPINDGLRRARLTKLGVDPARFTDALALVRVQSMSLLSRDEQTGAIQTARKKSELEGFIVPFALVMLLFMIVLTSSTSMLSAVAEDKMQRVYEMLLASASPFDLIMGKVVAAVALSLTSSVLYIAAGLFVLSSLALTGMMPPSLIAWFVIYLVADMMVLAALSAAMGSACASPNDAQHLAIVLIMPALIPIFVMMPVMQDPNSTFSTVMSLIPPFTPILMLLRQASPTGIPAWQPFAGLFGIILWTLAVTWAAARIFRIAILIQGKTASIPQLFRWAVRG